MSWDNALAPRLRCPECLQPAPATSPYSCSELMCTTRLANQSTPFIQHFIREMKSAFSTLPPVLCCCVALAAPAPVSSDNQHDQKALIEQINSTPHDNLRAQKCGYHKILQSLPVAFLSLKNATGLYFKFCSPKLDIHISAPVELTC